jgi:hypothetical protein
VRLATASSLPLNVRSASWHLHHRDLSHFARRQRSRLAQTPPGTFKLLQTSRRSDVLETLQLTETEVWQPSLAACNHETGYGTRPRLDLTLVHIVESVQILCLMHRGVALDDAHGVVLGHSFESLSHGLAEVTKGPSLRPTLLAEYGAGEGFGFREWNVDGWAVGVQDVNQVVLVSVSVLAFEGKWRPGPSAFET